MLKTNRVIHKLTRIFVLFFGIFSTFFIVVLFSGLFGFLTSQINWDKKIIDGLLLPVNKLSKSKISIGNMSTFGNAFGSPSYIVINISDIEFQQKSKSTLSKIESLSLLIKFGKFFIPKVSIESLKNMEVFLNLIVAFSTPPEISLDSIFGILRSSFLDTTVSRKKIFGPFVFYSTNNVLAHSEKANSDRSTGLEIAKTQRIFKMEPMSIIQKINSEKSFLQEIKYSFFDFSKQSNGEISIDSNGQLYLKLDSIPIGWIMHELTTKTNKPETNVHFDPELDASINIFLGSKNKDHRVRFIININGLQTIQQNSVFKTKSLQILFSSKKNSLREVEISSNFVGCKQKRDSVPKFNFYQKTPIHIQKFGFENQNLALKMNKSLKDTFKKLFNIILEKTPKSYAEQIAYPIFTSAYMVEKYSQEGQFVEIFFTFKSYKNKRREFDSNTKWGARFDKVVLPELGLVLEDVGTVGYLSKDKKIIEIEKAKCSSNSCNISGVLEFKDNPSNKNHTDLNIKLFGSETDVIESISALHQSQFFAKISNMFEAKDAKGGFISDINITLDEREKIVNTWGTFDLMLEKLRMFGVASEREKIVVSFKKPSRESIGEVDVFFGDAKIGKQLNINQNKGMKLSSVIDLSKFWGDVRVLNIPKFKMFDQKKTYIDSGISVSFSKKYISEILLKPSKINLINSDIRINMNLTQDNFLLELLSDKVNVGEINKLLFGPKKKSFSFGRNNFRSLISDDIQRHIQKIILHPSENIFVKKFNVNLNLKKIVLDNSSSISNFILIGISDNNSIGPAILKFEALKNNHKTNFLGKLEKNIDLNQTKLYLNATDKTTPLFSTLDFWASYYHDTKSLKSYLLIPKSKGASFINNKASKIIGLDAEFKMPNISFSGKIQDGWIYLIIKPSSFFNLKSGESKIFGSASFGRFIKMEDIAREIENILGPQNYGIDAKNPSGSIAKMSFKGKSKNLYSEPLKFNIQPTFTS